MFLDVEIEQVLACLTTRPVYNWSSMELRLLYTWIMMTIQFLEKCILGTSSLCDELQNHCESSLSCLFQVFLAFLQGTSVLTVCITLQKREERIRERDWAVRKLQHPVSGTNCT